MIVWRISRRVHGEQPLSGEGARLHGGRWNHAGTAVVYSSQSLSLALLEYLVNVSVIDLPDDLVSIQLEIPDGLKRAEIPLSVLPEDWRTYPGPCVDELKDIGTDWVKKAAAPVMVVPSVVIPSELNYLINPSHPLARRITIVSVEPFTLDARLSHEKQTRG
jgi:RES domain-containing protein